VGASWDAAELETRMAEYDALVAGPETSVPAALLRAGGRLQVVACTGADAGGVDVAEATRRGIVVVTTSGSAVVSEAEQALSLVLGCARGLVAADADLRSGVWDGARWATAGVDVRGKQLGLVGLGPASPLLAEAARALGMEVLSCDPRRPAQEYDEWAVRCVAPDEIFASADFVVVGRMGDVAAGGAEGRGTVVGAAELAQMKPGVRLVSLAGPGALDVEALSHALSDGRVAAAAVALAAGEMPAEGSPLRAADVLLAPRLEAPTVDARRRAAIAVAEQVAAVLRGEFPGGAVNVPVAAGDDAAELMPYLGLCTQLGRLLAQLADAPVQAVEITYGGSVAYFDTGLLTLGVLSGVLAGSVDGPVNYVNAEPIAQDQGVTVAEQRQSDIPDFPRLITVAAPGAFGTVSVSGTSLGPGHKPRLVRLFGEDIDIEPAPHMAFLRYVDAPGIGGRLGTLLGEWRVNIGHMSVGKGRLGNESVMALTLDEPLSPSQVEELIAHCDLAYARAVEL
jgi:D-3-phosphoglycerate dehydrogenase / 2-oxoglutarate reductase